MSSAGPLSRPRPKRPASFDLYGTARGQCVCVWKGLGRETQDRASRLLGSRLCMGAGGRQSWLEPGPVQGSLSPEGHHPAITKVTTSRPTWLSHPRPGPSAGSEPCEGWGAKAGRPHTFSCLPVCPPGREWMEQEGAGLGLQSPRTLLPSASVSLSARATSDAKLLGRVTGQDHRGRDKSGGATCILSYSRRHSAVEGSWGSPKCQARSGEKNCGFPQTA